MTLRWYGNSVSKKIEAASREAIWKLGQIIITEATPGAPVETGTLRRSAIVTMDALPDAEAVYEEAKGGRNMATTQPSKGTGDPVGYVSYNTPYAAWLHETFQWTPKIAGGPKWLERAFLAVKGRFTELVRREIKKRGG